jgi:TolB-like protein/tetratricopeptide (TPR) repeat protein
MGPPEREESLVKDVPVRRRGTPWIGGRARLATAAAVLVVVGVAIWWAWPQGTVPIGIARVVVLPFENLGAGGDDALAGGITAEAESRLAAVPGLEVVAHESARRYAGSDKPIARIASNLKATHVLSGSVHWDRSAAGPARVRVIAKLWQVSDQTTLWSEVFDRTASDLLGIQAEVATAVTRRVGRGLVPRSDATGAADMQPGAEAYEAYLRGLHHYRSAQSHEGLHLAATFFARAAQHDPTFPEAHAWLARTECAIYALGFERTPERRRAAQTAFENAATLSPDNPEVRIAAGALALGLDGEAAIAEREAESALKLGGSQRTCLLLKASARRYLGRCDEAVRDLERAIELSPADPALLAEIAITLMIAGRHEEAIPYCQRSIALEPAQHFAREWKARALLLARGDIAGSRAALHAVTFRSRPTVVRLRWLLDMIEGRFREALATARELSAEVTPWKFGVEVRPLLEAETWLAAGDPARSRATAEQACAVLAPAAEAEPSDPRYALALAWAEALAGRPREAEVRLRRTIAAEPPTREYSQRQFLQEALARVLLLGDRIDDAAAVVEDLLRGPSHPDAVPLVWLDPRWESLRDDPRLQRFAVGRPAAELTTR